MINEKIKNQAREFTSIGIKPLDALNWHQQNRLKQIIFVHVMINFSKKFQKEYMIIIK